jgi:hypothetical protein
VGFRDGLTVYWGENVREVDVRGEQLTHPAQTEEAHTIVQVRQNKNEKTEIVAAGRPNLRK